jgi:putative ABC transport system ATP-binding protein
MNTAYIECMSLTKVYRTRRNTINAITDINLKIERGEFVLLKGKSGAGKSTLLNIIGGLIKPTSGTVEIDGQVINNLNNMNLSNILLNKTGIIFQNLNLLPTYSIFENIELALAPKGLKSKKVRELIMPFIERFGLQDKINLLPEELSAGQQQKVAIIRTLVKQPSVILADEPTGSVDEESADIILNSLRDLRNNNNATILFATHGTVPDQIADSVYVISEGRILT